MTSNEEVAITDLINRLRGRYEVGPKLTNGEPEFGHRQFDPNFIAPIQLEAAETIEHLRKELRMAKGAVSSLSQAFMHLRKAEMKLRDQIELMRIEAEEREEMNEMGKVAP